MASPGATLLELLVAMGVIAILGALAAPAVLRERPPAASIDGTAQLLRQARRAAIMEQQNSAVWVYADRAYRVPAAVQTPSAVPDLSMPTLEPNWVVVFLPTGRALVHPAAPIKVGEAVLEIDPWTGAVDVSR